MRPHNVLACFVLLSALLLIWSYILRSVWIKASKLGSFSMKLGVTLSTLLYLFLFLEALFYYSFAVPDTFGFTLAAQRWQERYWRPINSHGYRDVEHYPEEFQDKTVLFVVGDSFVAGPGLAYREHRFFNYLQR